ncbi:glyoxalase superfamily protein [Sporosarcina sp. FSL K6-1522]|uniref:glyoxalase superfamily protein n=1 Tax=Sporosarcina sp. FSL K6-1522 TaxID=2921554 RepID=UPI00315A19D2
MNQMFRMESVVPILRIFDIEKAKAFYVDYLGFIIDWEHRFEENFPRYLQISRGHCAIHLTEHHGDCSPGAAIRVSVSHIQAFTATLHAKDYNFARPCLELTPWGMQELTVMDPFNNRIIFFENCS